MCKALGRTPQELSAQWDSFDWEWAITNVNRDNQELGKLLSSFMDELTWWLQPEMRRNVEKSKATQWPDVADEAYLAELRRDGVSEEYIAKERARMTAEREALNENFDEMTVIKGPNG